MLTIAGTIGCTRRTSTWSSHLRTTFFGRAVTSNGNARRGVFVPPTILPDTATKHEGNLTREDRQQDHPPDLAPFEGASSRKWLGTQVRQRRATAAIGTLWALP